METVPGRLRAGSRLCAILAPFHHRVDEVGGMQFGFTLKPDHDIERFIALTRQAEAAGFNYGWLFDSHVLWRDPYPLLVLMALPGAVMMRLARASR